MDLDISTLTFNDLCTAIEEFLKLIMSPGEIEEYSIDKEETQNTISYSALLSDEAKQLLIEASKDRNGRIEKNDYSGITIRTNKKEIVKDSNAKIKAIWKGVLNELETHLLIEAASFKKEIYNVTATGYKIAKQLKLINSK